MPWSYGNPATKVLWAVRFELQDTNTQAHLLEDEEIEYSISLETRATSASATSSTVTMAEVLSAAAHCMEALARRFSAQADTVLGSLRVSYTKQAEGYEKRAEKLRARAQGSHAPWALLNEGEREARQNETEATQPFFQRGQFQSPFTQGESGEEILRISEGQG